MSVINDDRQKKSTDPQPVTSHLQLYLTFFQKPLHGVKKKRNTSVEEKWNVSVIVTSPATAHGNFYALHPPHLPQPNPQTQSTEQIHTHQMTAHDPAAYTHKHQEREEQRLRERGISSCVGVQIKTYESSFWESRQSSAAGAPLPRHLSVTYRTFCVVWEPTCQVFSIGLQSFPTLGVCVCVSHILLHDTAGPLLSQNQGRLCVCVCVRTCTESISCCSGRRRVTRTCSSYRRIPKC